MKSQKSSQITGDPRTPIRFNQLGGASLFRPGLDGTPNRARAASLCEEASGASMLEYLLIAGLLGLAAVVSMSGMTRPLSSSFNAIGSVVQSSTHH